MLKIKGVRLTGTPERFIESSFEMGFDRTGDPETTIDKFCKLLIIKFLPRSQKDAK